MPKSSSPHASTTTSHESPRVITNQHPINAVYMRGGTSKGVFFHARDLPPAGPARDAILLRVMGSPDPLQIDGMGGTYSSTSKVVVVDEPHDGTVTYWFGQVDITTPHIDWQGNCGNLTTAVGPFVIEEGLVAAYEPFTTLMLHNGNTDTRIEADVPVANGSFQVTGAHVVHGVPGTGSAVVTRFLDPAGKTTGQLLPLGPTTDVEMPDGQSIPVSVVDASSVYAFVRASDLGIDMTTADPATLNTEATLLQRLEHLRSALAVRLGRVDTPADAATQSATVPRIMVFEPGDHTIHVVARAVMMGVFHRALPMTGALCLAAAAHTPGTLVAASMETAAASKVVIGHPRGTATVEVTVKHHGATVTIDSLGVTRTARRIMDGRVYVEQYDEITGSLF